MGAGFQQWLRGKLLLQISVSGRNNLMTSDLRLWSVVQTRRGAGFQQWLRGKLLLEIPVSAFRVHWRDRALPSRNQIARLDLRERFAQPRLRGLRERSGT